MKRREFISLLGGAAMAPAARAQPAPPALRLGTAQILPRDRAQWVGLEQRLRELGYVEGQNLTVEYLHVDSALESHVEAVKELLHRKVDIIVATGPEVAVKSAVMVTPSLPIVMVAIDYDPVAIGYVKSLSRPGGNVTGVVTLQIELTMKRLQLMKEAFPGTPEMTVLWDRLSADQWEVAQSTAPTLGLRLFGAELKQLPYDYEAAITQAPPEFRRALIVLASPVTFPDRFRLAEAALRQRIASMNIFRVYVEAGGLMSYGPDLAGMFRRAPDLVDRIARGAKPADIPVEQPTRFELVVNLKTAKAIGVELPTSILLRADEVIE